MFSTQTSIGQFSAMSKFVGLLSINERDLLVIFGVFSVALIQTIESIRFGQMVMPVRLTPDRISEGNVTAVMAGFGQTRVEPRTDVKQFLEMKTMRSPDCRRHYRRFPFNAVRIFDSNICFSNPVGRGTCGGKCERFCVSFEVSQTFLTGDSGGSITINQISVSYIIFLHNYA